MAIEELLHPIQPQVSMPVQELHQASSEEDEEMKVDAEESSNYQMADESEEIK